MKIIREKVHGGNPFTAADFSDVRGSLQGWRSRHMAFKAVMDTTRPKKIIEVGVWMGKAIVHMARTAAELEIEDIEILAVDTWLGSPEHWLEPKWHESLNRVGGYPTIYRTFAKNMIEQGLTDIVTPLPVPADTAAHILRACEVEADLIHLDAGHEFDAVYADIQNYWPMVSEGGVIIGDDYLIGAYPDVARAFKTFAADEGLALLGTKGKCVMSRQPVPGLAAYPDLGVLENFAPGEVPRPA